MLGIQGVAVPAPPTTDAPLDVRVHVHAVVRALWACVVVFAVTGAASAWLPLAGYPTVFRFVNLFNMDIEMSAPTWFSASVLLACAGVLGLLAVVAGAARDGRREVSPC